MADTFGKVISDDVGVQVHSGVGDTDGRVVLCVRRNRPGDQRRAYAWTLADGPLCPNWFSIDFCWINVPQEIAQLQIQLKYPLSRHPESSSPSPRFTVTASTGHYRKVMHRALPREVFTCR
jgi:hypothetical protein